MSFKIVKSRWLLIIVWILGALPASAFDLYRFVTKDCQNIDGGIVGVDDQLVTVLTTQGKIVRVDEALIIGIGQFQLKEYPFGVLPPEGNFGPLLLVDQDTGDTPFWGYATQFIDNLVLFVDVAGQTHVVDMAHIVSLQNTLRVPTDLLPKPTRLKHVDVILGDIPVGNVCGGRDLIISRPDVLEPDHIFVDQLQINEMIERYRKGFRDLESLRERTLFYARPILFDRRTRLGFGAIAGIDAVARSFPENVAPVYLEFGSGTPYRFQSNTILGSHTSTLTPMIDPFFGVSSKFKSHVIHGMFSANFSGFAAGSSVYANKAYALDKLPTYPWTSESFNHLTLLGVDYGSYSVSYGYYFPAFAFAQGSTFFEILPPNASPVFHLGYMTTKSENNVVFFYTDSSRDTGISNGTGIVGNKNRFEGEGIKWVNSNAETYVPTHYKVRSYTMHASTAWTFTEPLRLGIDAAVTKAKMSIDSLGFDISDPKTPKPIPGTATDSIDTIRFASSVFSRLDLGNRVALKGQVIIYYNRFNGGIATRGNQTEDHKETLYNYLAALEFLL